MDFEDSTDTVQALVIDGVLKKEDVGIWKPDSLNETKALCEEVIKSKRFETIVIDTGSRLQTMQMDQYISKHPTVVGDGNRKPTRDKYTVFQADYGFSYRILDEFYVWLCKQPIRVILNTHAKKIYQTTTNENGSNSSTLIRVEPDLTPKLTESMQELFSMVGYLTNKPGVFGKPGERKLQVNPTTIITAKNRMHIQELELINPTYKGIFKC